MIYDSAQTLESKLPYAVTWREGQNHNETPMFWLQDTVPDTTFYVYIIGVKRCDKAMAIVVVAYCHCPLAVASPLASLVRYL